LVISLTAFRPPMSWAIQAVLIWVLVSGGGAVLWIAGYRMGYQKGTDDAIDGSLDKTDRRVNR